MSRHGRRATSKPSLGPFVVNSMLTSGLTSNFGQFSASSNISFVPRVLSRTAVFNSSSNRIVAAQWYMKVTLSANIFLSSCEIPKSGNVQSPQITSHWSTIVDTPRCSFSWSNNYWKEEREKKNHEIESADSNFMFPLNFVWQKNSITQRSVWRRVKNDSDNHWQRPLKSNNSIPCLFVIIHLIIFGNPQLFHHLTEALQPHRRPSSHYVQFDRMMTIIMKFCLT